MKVIMRSIVAAVILILAGTVAAPLPAAAADTYVNGYTKKNGTYVAPHYRSRPDGNTSNNWSTKGNVNPYTGKAGTKNPYGSSTLGGSSGYGSPLLGSGNRRRGRAGSNLLGQ